MKINVYGSSSSGNFYTVEDQGEVLLLEAGIKIKYIKKALDFNFSNVVGCLVSHEHKDHSQSIAELLNLGVAVGSNPNTMLTVDHFRKFVIEPNKPLMIGAFKVMAFELVHDVENYGYVIKTPSGKKILFATDTQFILNQFKDIDIYMIECNFDLHSMRKAIKCGKLDPEVLVRVAQTHMSLETVSDYLKKADLSNAKEIVLIHLSDNNSCEHKYIEHIQGLTGIKTIAADKGTVIEVTDGPEF